MPARISVVIVTTNERDAIERSLPALKPELRPGDELIISDNASSDGTVERARELVPDVRVVQNGGNVGFPAGVNAGAAVATGDVLLLLNPDAAVAPGFADAIRAPLEDGRGWDAWQALVTMDDGERINTSGGIVHFSGISWAGDLGGRVEGADLAAREVEFASGACLAIPMDVWRALGGFPAHFFLYFDDVDISMRIRLRGGTVGIEPSARADHSYTFTKGALKWRMLERNRWATIIRCYPGPLLALLAPALVATEAAILAASVAGGWAPQKLRSWGLVLTALPMLLRERRAIQSSRVIGAAEFARWLSADLSSEHLGAAGRSRVVGGGLRLYWRLVRVALGVR
ncbi:MAG TPA: glycosyltransferase [Thermoleophilaceae bacterium]